MALSNGGSQSNYAYNSALPFSSGVGTVMFWIYFNALPSSAIWVPVDLVASGSNLGLYADGWAVPPSVRILSDWGVLSSQYYQTSASNWYHMTITYDGTDFRLYVDDSLLITHTDTRDMDALYLFIPHWTESGNCALAHVRAWDATLTLAEIQAERYLATPSKTADRIDWWTLANLSTGLTGQDGNYNLTAVGSLTVVDGPSAVVDAVNLAPIRRRRSY